MLEIGRTYSKNIVVLTRQGFEIIFGYFPNMHERAKFKEIQ